MDKKERTINEFECKCGYIFKSEKTTKDFYNAIERQNVKPNSIIYFDRYCPKCSELYTIIRSIDKNKKLSPMSNI